MDEEKKGENKRLMKKKVGYRKKLGKEISMCVGIDASMAEVSRIVPTIEGAIIYMLFYSLKHKKDEGWLHFSRKDSKFQESLKRPLLDARKEEKEKESIVWDTTLTGEESTVFTLLSKCVASKTLFVAIQGVFDLPKPPKAVTFSLGKSKTTQNGDKGGEGSGKGKESRLKLEMEEIPKS